MKTLRGKQLSAIGILVGALMLAGSAFGYDKGEGPDTDPLASQTLKSDSRTSRSFAFENDILVPGSRDQDYTYGLNLTFSGKGVEDHWASLHEPLDYAEIDITTDLAREQEMIERSGRRTVPQIFIDGDAIGGYDDLANVNASGELDQRLGLALELLEANHRGEIEVDGKGHTGTQGIFAAGDVTDDQSKQIVIAAGSGASAALGAFEYLVSQV